MSRNPKVQEYYDRISIPETLERLIEWFSDISEHQEHGHRDRDTWKENGEIDKDNSGLRLILLRTGQTTICNCRYISGTAQTLLKDVGIDSRFVEFIAANELYGDVRHGALEVSYRGDGRPAGKPVHVDLTMGVMFKGKDGEYLSSLDIKDAIAGDRFNDVEVHRLGNGKIVNPDFPTPNFQDVIDNEVKLREYYANVFNSIMIGNTVYTRNTTDYNFRDIRRNALSHMRDQLKFVDRNAFIDRFYQK